MPEDADPVTWVERQAVVRLPDHIDLSNAGSINEELLALINRGAAVLIVDMTATASCDYAGAETLVRTYKRAVASGRQLRLVVPAGVVGSGLTLAGLDRLVPVYPSREAAIAAGVPVAQAGAGAGPSRVSQDVLGAIAGELFQAGLSLQAAFDSADDAGRQHIMQALQHLDEAIRAVRGEVFAAPRWESRSDCEPPDDGR